MCSFTWSTLHIRYIGHRYVELCDFVKSTTVGLFLCYLWSLISSVFLYNSEIWTTTKDMEEAIDTYQRTNLRKILNIRYPRKITNEMLYNTTNQKPWSRIVKKRKLSFFGHMARLPDDAPAKLALNEFRNTKAKKIQGGSKTDLAQANRKRNKAPRF